LNLCPCNSGEIMKRIETYLDEARLEHIPKTQLHIAIGRLVLFASYPIVKIYNDGESDLIANYYDEDMMPKFTIGAVWRGTEYTFHS